MIRKILQSLKTLSQSHEDAKIGRKLVGTDRYGNLYYQYYDQNGAETKRMSQRIDPNAPFVDPIWEEWIRNKAIKPFTPEQLELKYQQEAEHFQKIKQFEYQDAQSVKAMNKPEKQDKEKQFKPQQWQKK